VTGPEAGVPANAGSLDVTVAGEASSRLGLATCVSRVPEGFERARTSTAGPVPDSNGSRPGPFAAEGWDARAKLEDGYCNICGMAPVSAGQSAALGAEPRSSGLARNRPAGWNTSIERPAPILGGISARRVGEDGAGGDQARQPGRRAGRGTPPPLEGSHDRHSRQPSGSGSQPLLWGLSGARGPQQARQSRAARGFSARAAGRDTPSPRKLKPAIWSPGSTR